MWTDTHLHLDASEYDSDRAAVVQHARELHVTRFVLPAVSAFNFDTVKILAHQTPGAVYCLGIHPVFVDKAHENDLLTLKQKIEESIGDAKFAGIGEIGLDGFVPGLDWEKQVRFFHAQLKMARDFDLPVVMHVRKAQDPVLKGLRIYKPRSGIAHAFNGSFQQAEHFLNLNMCLGFGGACTFTRALQLRRLASALPEHALVLETDGPDIAPEWINKQRNAPEHLPRIAQTIAELRGLSLQELSQQTEVNAQRVLPALALQG
ncbi:MAG: TatD family hydrolase [Burkholderiales bacterium]|jgi:TatD DNase family protein|uniref:TatD family hydrolase n=1 Tax=Limnobacter sp. TaxID=2003368 RepID=UPI0039BD58A5|nr:TatD family hydrolase [Burkholderiales bacterium]